MVILLFAAAGALVGAGAGGAWYIGEVSPREAARRLSSRDRAALADALRQELDLAEFRATASAASVSPDQVLAGYEALRDGRLTEDEPRQQIRKLRPCPESVA
jgi:hypothetical protein